MPTDVFLTGSYGKCGTAIIDHLHGVDADDFTYFNRSDRHDHPYGDVEQGVDNGDRERGSPQYERAAARMSSMWHSRRDFAHQMRRVLDDDSVEFGVFSGVSDNRSRWFGLESARSELGYRPRDDAAEWTA